MLKFLDHIDINSIGTDYSSFMKMFIHQVDNPDLNNPDELRHYENRKLNLFRTQKWTKTFTPSTELIDAVKSITKPQTWMVITETWCGDSAQNLPIIGKAASLNDKINLRIVFRDENLEIMDNYLTNGSRSIPKLVAFDESGNELFLWGPRPESVQNIVMNLKNEGLDKSEINKQLHLWYAKNHGEEIDKELSHLIKKVTLY